MPKPVVFESGRHLGLRGGGRLAEFLCRIRRLVWLLVAIVLPALSATGCSRSISSTASAPGAFGSTFLGVGTPNECQNQCWAKIVPYIRSELGLDPDALGTYDIGRYQELLRALQTECEPTGGVLRAVSVPSLFDGLKAGPRRRAVVIDKKGHLYFVLGAIEPDGQVCCQFVHGDSSVLLLTKAEFLNAGFQEAWELGNRREGGVPIRVGSGALKINEIIHNFGLVRPHETVDCTYVLKNAGTIPLVIGKPNPSCACTTSTVLGPTELMPDEVLKLPVSVSASDTVSMRQYVQLTISDGANSYAPRNVVLELLGSEIASLKVMPPILEFGTVIPERSSHPQSFTMQEVTTDRFTVKKVDVGQLPLVHKMDVVKDHHGLRTYRFQCTLRGHETTPGPHSEFFAITTDSRFHPIVRIAVRYDMAARVEAVPSVAALGEIPVGEPCRQQVRLTSPTGDPLAVEIEESPAEAVVKIDPNPTEPVLTLTVTLSRPGPWHGLIKGRAQAGSHRASIEIPCAAYGKAR
jgi:hypothetical protein